jgi:hypothetical protein
MAFKGRYPTRSKIVINKKIIEQLNIFNYLGNMVSYEKEKDIVNKITTFLKITGLINITFKPSSVPFPFVPLQRWGCLGFYESF